MAKFTNTNFDGGVAALKAKRELAMRCFDIGMKYLPEGWTFRFRKSLSGRAWCEGKFLEAPKPVTRKALYVWLHECGHAHLHSDGVKRTRHLKEHEAERFAHDTMRKEGIAIPREMTQRAKRYVSRKITQAEARGAKNINKAALLNVNRRGV